ncbi:hypothetical protein MMC13_004924 [Lambiella insularis]|nr:hypothetical protein [Lambiella insularis]
MIHEDSLAISALDEYRSVHQNRSIPTHDIYICSHIDCHQRFLTLLEVQEHKREIHAQPSPPPALHTFYVLHAALARHAVYKSTARFWCRLCSEEKAFWDTTALADHARTEHPEVDCSASIEQLAMVVASTRVSPSASEQDAIRASSYDTIVGDADNQEKSGTQPKVDWDRYRAVLSDLYIRQDKSLDQVMAYMSETYGFHAKMRVYKETFKLWGFDKNIPAREMGLIVTMVEKRKREDGKDTQVFYKERPVPLKKMNRFKRRKLQVEPTGESSLRALPPYIRFETPTEDSNNARPAIVEKTPSSDTMAFSRSLKSLADATLKDYWDCYVDNGPVGSKEDEAISRRIGVWKRDEARQTGHRLMEVLTEASIREMRNDYYAAESFYREALELADSDNEFISLYEALRGIIRIHGRRDDLKSVIPELQRLVGGCMYLFGPNQEVYQTLALELAVLYYAEGRQLEGNALALRVLTLYDACPIDKTKEIAGSWLLARTCRWNPVIAESTLYNKIYWRLIKYYEEAKNWPDAITLTLDISESLNDSDLTKTSESYLRRAYCLYVRDDKPGRYNHSYRLLDLTLAQLKKSGGAWMDRVHLLFTVLRDDLINYYFTALPVVHEREPISKLLQCYTALHKLEGVTTACVEIRTRSVLAKHWSQHDWTVVIDELVSYSRELRARFQDEHTNAELELFSLAKFFGAVRDFGRKGIEF